MARPVRINCCGTQYHITNHLLSGLLFDSPLDIDNFEKCLFRCAARAKIQLLSYALMHNHFHLECITSACNLSAFMCAFASQFAQQYNRDHDRKGAGPIFVDRFHNEIVCYATHDDRLSRYIHLNPINTIDASALSTHEKTQYLINYGRSSLKYYMGIEDPAEVKCLDINHTLARFGDTAEECLNGYMHYLEEGLEMDFDLLRDNLFSDVVDKVILGDRKFLKENRQNIADPKGTNAAAQKLKCDTIEEVTETVKMELGVTPDELKQKYHTGLDLRNLVIFVASQTVVHRETLTQIGRKIGDLTISSVSKIVHKMEKKLKFNPKLKTLIELIIESIHTGHNTHLKLITHGYIKLCMSG